jgi:hypothetical protein
VYFCIGTTSLRHVYNSDGLVELLQPFGWLLRFAAGIGQQHEVNGIIGYSSGFSRRFENPSPEKTPRGWSP